jgi:uncharacterized protein YggE
MPHRSSLALVVCALVLLPLPLAALAEGARTIDVTGHGEANAKPDTMVVSFSIDNQAPSADKCARIHAEKARALVDALKSELGDDAKIETADYSLNPTYTYINQPTSQPEERAPEEVWAFECAVTASVDSLDMIAPAIEAGMAAGATQIGQGGVNFLPADEGSSTALFGSPFGSRWDQGKPVRMKAVPQIPFLVNTQAPTAPEAARKGARMAHEVGQAIKDKLGNHVDVGLSNFSIRRLEPANRPAEYVSPPQQQRQEFAAHSTVTAETQKLDLLGSVVEAGMKAGASRLNQVSFTLKDTSDARKDAIERASEDARTKADSVAHSMGVKLKQILRITTNPQVRPQVVSGEAFFAARMSRESATIPVMPHEVGFTADVSVTYEIE